LAEILIYPKISAFLRFSYFQPKPHQQHLSRSYISIQSFSLLASMMLAAACSTSETAEQEVAQSSVAQKEVLTQVAIDTAITQLFYYILETTGKIESSAATQLKAQQSGNINFLGAKVGDYVQKGQRLVALDEQSLSLAKERAALALTKAELEFDNILLGYPSVIAKDGYQKDSLMLRLRVSSGLKGAELDLKEANIRYKQTKLFAPFSGVIHDLKVAPGAFVNAGDELMSIYSINPLLLKIELLETEAALLQKGMPVAVQPSNTKRENTLAGKVDYINPMVNEQGLVEVGIALSNPKKNTWLGMNATASVMIPQGNRLLVPKQAVVLRSGKAVVFTLKAGLAKWNYVSTGLDNGVSMEVTEGLSEGDLVITTNNLQLAHDAPVTVTSND
jgi:RND family efflux transporter MFP subunit